MFGNNSFSESRLNVPVTLEKTGNLVSFLQVVVYISLCRICTSSGVCLARPLMKVHLLDAERDWCLQMNAEISKSQKQQTTSAEWTFRDVYHFFYLRLVGIVIKQM